MTKKLGNLFYFKRGGEPVSCGFLEARELDAWIENRLSDMRMAAFKMHAGSGCASCALLAEDLGVFRDVVTRGPLHSERREFDATKAILKAEFRQKLAARAEKKQTARVFGLGRNWAMGAAAAALLLALVTIPLLREGAPGRITLPGGESYTAQPMAFSSPPVVRGETEAEDLWARAGAAYTAERYGRAAGLFAEIAELDPGSADAALYLGISQLMDGDHETAIDTLERARRIAPAGAAASFYLGVAGLATGQVERATDDLRRAVAAGGAYGERAAELLTRIDAD
jgi:tetratricopeptide (TPR) repeat protein